MVEIQSKSESALLSLPPELRVQIFEYVFRDVRCRRPLFITDVVSTPIANWKPPNATALLAVCRTTYHDCIGLLYASTPVDISVRNKEPNDSFSKSNSSYGAIEECNILRNIRHAELEITYDSTDSPSMDRTISRLRRLVAVLNEVGKLRTLELVFFDQSRPTPPLAQHEFTADPILDVAISLKCERLAGLSRNLASRRHMSDEKWEAMRATSPDGTLKQEEFQEIGFDYWMHRLET